MKNIELLTKEQLKMVEQLKMFFNKIKNEKINDKATFLITISDIKIKIYITEKKTIFRIIKHKPKEINIDEICLSLIEELIFDKDCLLTVITNTDIYKKFNNIEMEINGIYSYYFLIEKNKLIIKQISSNELFNSYVNSNTVQYNMIYMDDKNAICGWDYLNAIK